MVRSITHYKSYDSFKTKKSIEQKQRAKDRTLYKSKYLKDDFIIPEASLFGVVIEVRYNDCYVMYQDKVVLACLSKEINGVCNQILFPGDKVVLLFQSGKYYIKNLVRRTSLLSRTKKDSTKLDDLGTTKHIAANIDLAVIVVAAKEPPMHSKFIDRYLLVLQNSNIPVLLCFNKCDMKTLEDEKVLDIYRKIGIAVVETSTVQNIGIDELKRYLYHKQAIFVGNSGVGKSSLTNAIMDTEETKTSHVSEKSKRGRHTTTTSKYYIWNDSSSIIDTPGIRSLDVTSFEPIEIQNYFSEFQGYRCKYNDCCHYNEPYESCDVKQAVVNGLISMERFESYVKIMGDVLDDNNFDLIIQDLQSRKQ